MKLRQASITFRSSPFYRISKNRANRGREINQSKKRNAAAREHMLIKWKLYIWTRMVLLGSYLNCIAAVATYGSERSTNRVLPLKLVETLISRNKNSTISFKTVVVHKQNKTPWSESSSELYRQSDSRLSGKLVLTFADRGCHVVSVTDSYDRILGFLDRSRYFSFK
jgi:hypothetical protein